MNLRSCIARYALNTLAALSLLLCVASVGLWVRSYWRADGISFHSFRTADGRADKRTLLAISASAHFIISTDTRQMIVVDFVHHPGGFLDRSPQGWRFFVHPASSPSQASPAGFHVLGLLVAHIGGNGIYTSDGKVQMNWSITSVAIPHWMVVLISAALPMWWWLMRRRRLLRVHRLNHGLCVGCGYDLRATPDRCPECGMEVGKETAWGSREAAGRPVQCVANQK